MKHRAAASVMLAGILWGIISIFIKRLSAVGLDSLQISVIRMIIASVFFTAFVLIRNPKSLKIDLKDIWMFIGTGLVSTALFNVFYFYTMIKSQASVAVVLLYTSPIFVMLMSKLFFKEKITLKKISALIITFIGCVFVTGILGGGYKIAPLVLLTGICSGFFYALYTIFGRFALKKYDTYTVTAYTFIIGMIGSLPLAHPAEIIKTVSADVSIIPWCIGIGIICTVLPCFFYTWGLGHMESGKAAILVAIEPLIGAIIGMTLFNESVSAFKIIGIALILGAIVLLNFEVKPKFK